MYLLDTDTLTQPHRKIFIASGRWFTPWQFDV